MAFPWIPSRLVLFFEFDLLKILFAYRQNRETRKWTEEEGKADCRNKERRNGKVSADWKLNLVGRILNISYIQGDSEALSIRDELMI